MERNRKQVVFGRKANKSKRVNPRLIAASNCLNTTSLLSKRKPSMADRLLGKEKSSPFFKMNFPDLDC